MAGHQDVKLQYFSLFPLCVLLELSNSIVFRYLRYLFTLALIHTHTREQQPTAAHADLDTPFCQPVVGRWAAGCR